MKLEDLMAKSGILEKKASVCQRQVTQTLSDTVPLAQKQASYDNWLENMEVVYIVLDNLISQDMVAF